MRNRYSLAAVFMAFAIAGCDSPEQTIQISTQSEFGKKEETYFNCNNDQICHAQDTRIAAGKVMVGSSKESCALASDAEISRYQAMCRKKYPDKSPD